MEQKSKIEKAAEAYHEHISQLDYYNGNPDSGYDGFLEGAEWAEKELKKPENNVTLSFHVCNIPCAEEVMAGANAKYEAYFVSVPKNLLPNELLEVITKDSDHKYISQVALLKGGLV